MELTSPTSKGINASTLKMIAIIGMTMDHIGTVFLAQLPSWAQCILFAPGGLTFPIMAFLLTEGYRHTSDYQKYRNRLLLFALISFVPFAWAFLPFFNVMFTLLLGLITIYLYDNMKNRTAFWFAFAGITLLTTFCDWAWAGVPMILCYHTISNPRKRLIVPVLIAWGLVGGVSLLRALGNSEFVLMSVLPNLLYAFVGCTATNFLLQQYNGEKGNSSKYFFYIYYPVHLVVLSLIRGLMFGIWIPF